MYLIKKFIYLFILLNITNNYNVNCDINKNAKTILTPKIYSNIFARRREEQKLVINHLINIDNYEKKYKMIEIAIDALIKMIKENKNTLDIDSYGYDGEFPNEFNKIESLTTILENTCLFNEILIRMPIITGKIIKKKPDVKILITWGTDITLKYTHLLDENTIEMLKLLQIQYNANNYDNIINNDIENYLKRQENYVTAENVPNIMDNKLNKKIKEKTKRGPKLTSGKMEL